MSKRPAAGNPYCCYCKRPLAPADDGGGQSFTLDHVHAKSQGGWRRVPCCKKCNLLKDDLPANDWFWFIGAFPRWWKLFDAPQQVVSAVREEYSRRAYARKALLAT